MPRMLLTVCRPHSQSRQLQVRRSLQRDVPLTTQLPQLLRPLSCRRSLRLERSLARPWLAIELRRRHRCLPSS